MNFSFENAELASTKKKKQLEQERLNEKISRVDIDTYPDVDRPLNELNGMTAEKRRELKNKRDSLRAKPETKKNLNNVLNNLMNLLS